MSTRTPHEHAAGQAYAVTVSSGHHRRVNADGYRTLASGALEFFCERRGYCGGFQETVCIFAPGAWESVGTVDVSTP